MMVPGGVLFDLTIHDVDLINHIASNDVEFVFATGGKVKNTEFEDHVNLIIKFKTFGMKIEKDSIIMIKIQKN